MENANVVVRQHGERCKPHTVVICHVYVNLLTSLHATLTIRLYLNIFGICKTPEIAII